MSKQSSINYPETYSYQKEISIRNEYLRFACMFYLFTFLAFLTAIFLLFSANNYYYEQSESMQRRFIPYSILGILSFALFIIFFLGSVVYTIKVIRTFRSEQTSNMPPILAQSTDQIPRKKLSKSNELFIMNTDESYYTSTRAIAEAKPRTTNNSTFYSPCQTDV